MAKIICPNADLVHITKDVAELSCEPDCIVCNGKGFNEENIIETFLIYEFVNHQQVDIYDNGKMLYIGDLMQFVEDMNK